MKRPMTLTAGILGIVSHALMMILSLVSVVGIIAILDLGASSGADPDALAAVGIISLILIVICVVVGILGLIFNILAVKTWNKSTADYKAKKGKIITAIVFNFIGAGVIFIAGNIIISVLVMLMLIASAVLLIVDLCLEKKRVPVEAQVQETAKETVAKKTDLEDRIEKLNNMKDQGLISEEEYQELKKSYIKEKLNG